MKDDAKTSIVYCPDADSARIRRGLDDAGILRLGQGNSLSATGYTTVIIVESTDAAALQKIVDG